MDATRFDAVARLFATRRSRRAAIGGVGLSLAAASVPRAPRVASQETTPAGTPEVMTSTDPHPSADAPAKTEYLFVQPFAGGTWTPKPGDDGVYNLTLSGVPAQTVYFSDRPERIFGLWPTQEFLDDLGFTPANPPNAAVVTRTSDDADDDVLVVELLNPDYDAATGTLTYEARVLSDYGEAALAHAARRQSDYDLPEQLGPGGLFIDSLDCSDGCATCYQIVNGQTQTIGRIDTVGYCESGGSARSHMGRSSCNPCNDDGKSQYYGKLCNEAFPSRCLHTCDETSCEWDCYADLSADC